MRQIKFRGQTIGGEWVTGNLSILEKDFSSTVKKGYYISNSAGAPFAFMVRPESVCQFTGLKDKNGTEIYEGDQFAPDTDNEEVKSVVRWDETFAKFVVDSYGYNYHIGEGSQEVYDNELSICDTYDLGDMILEYCQVIGNIHTQDGGQEG